MHGVAAGDGVALQEVVEEAGQRRELAADRGAGQATVFELSAPGEDVRPGNGANSSASLSSTKPQKSSRSF